MVWTNSIVHKGSDIVDSVTMNNNAKTLVSPLLHVPTMLTTGIETALNPISIGPITRTAAFSSAVNADDLIVLPWTRLRAGFPYLHQWRMVAMFEAAAGYPPSRMMASIRAYSPVPGVATGATNVTSTGDTLAAAFLTVFVTPTQSVYSPTQRSYAEQSWTVPYTFYTPPPDDQIAQVRFTPVSDGQTVVLKNVTAYLEMWVTEL